MSTAKVDSTKRPEQAKKDSAKKVDINALEEDDEFEEFPVEEWISKETADEEGDGVNVWEDNWDDDTVEDDFSKQLRTELEKHGVKSGDEKPR